VELPVVCEVVRVLEARRFSAPKLVALSECLRLGSASASRDLGRLLRLMTLLSQRDNPMFMLLSYMLLWGAQFAMGISRWNRRHGASMLAWLEAVGEFEALISLATYASEHPRDPFPEFTGAGPLMQAQGIGHPLLDEAVCVRNDFQIGESPRFLVISGSNMSGKSTFLRAVALNAVLARMGAPVRCARLTLSDLQVGASILVQDSLAEGRSHFLAELERLRRMIDAAGRGPLLFVVDEILIGTNSSDRLVAAEWVVRALVARGAVGLISTHDLALTGIVNAPGLDGANYHFADTGDPSGMQFDYRLRPGVVERSNALSIVRSLGIETGEGLN
jgi:DNA mismatch repair ATPase MutS